MDGFRTFFNVYKTVRFEELKQYENALGGVLIHRCTQT